MTATRLGPDATAIERIRSRPLEPLVVVAGAGSGKTTNLVERAATALAEGGIDPAAVAIITFTDRAARELVHRLRRDGRIEGIDRAYVGTIHGFCQRILRQHPVEVGLPPAFSTVDEITSSATSQQRRRDLVRRLLDLADDDAELEEALGVLTVVGGPNQLEPLVSLIDSQWDRFERADLSVPSMQGLQDRLDRELADLDAVLANEWVADPANDDKLACAVRSVVVPWRRGLPAASLAELAGAVEAVGGLGQGGTRAWDARTGHSVKEVRELVKAVVARVALLATDLVLRRILRPLVPLVVDGARARLAAGELGFDDLLVLTRRLVTDHASVRDELRSRWQLVFVDEFQDTDPVQFEIIRTLCDPRTDGRAGPVLFAVGDPKQAIYAFRNADVALFQALAEESAADGRIEALTANHRTRPAVAAWINAVMAERFVGKGVEHQAPWEALVPTRSDEPDDPGAPVSLLGVGDDGLALTHESAAAASAQEARDIVALVHDAVGTWLVGASSSGSARPARFGDVAVLIRSRAGLAQLERTMRDAGVPYRIEGGSLVYESREVYELLRVLRAVDDPSNEALLVHALRTTVLGCSDLDLVRFRRGGDDGRSRPWRLPRPGSPAPEEPSARAVHEALGVIARFAAAKHALSPAQMLAAVYDERLGLAASRFEGAQVQAETWRRVRFVIDEARQWSDATGGTLHEYLRWVDARIEQVDRSEVATDEGEDSVRVLTIHAAKGLQFPIVVVAGLGRQEPSPPLRQVRWPAAPAGAAPRPEVRLGKLRTEAVRDADSSERDAAEEARLVYVACTRAQDHLVLALHFGRSSTRGPGARLHDALQAARAAGEMADHRAPAESAAVVDDAIDLDELQRAAAEEPAPVLDRPPTRRTVWTPSGLAKLLGDRAGPVAVQLTDADPSGATPTGQGVLGFDEPEPSLEDEEDDAPSWTGAPSADAGEARDPGHRKDPPSGVERERSPGRYGTSIGIAVHEVLQRLDLEDPAGDLRPLVRAACDAADVAPEHHDDAERLARSIVGAPLFSELCRSASRRREAYVGTTLGEGGSAVTLWGYVDAVFVDEHGHLVVVDFKTDAAVTSEDELRERYRHQLVGYAVALARATGRHVGRAVLLVGRRNGLPAAEITIPLPEDAERTIHAALITAAEEGRT